MPARSPTSQVLLGSGQAMSSWWWPIEPGKISRLIQTRGRSITPRIARWETRHLGNDRWRGRQRVDSRIGSASSPRRLTTFGGRNMFPIWSGDGSRVAYPSTRKAIPQSLRNASTAPGWSSVTRPASGIRHVPESSPDGRYLSFDEIRVRSYAQGAVACGWKGDGIRR